jgi:ergothioneine biosynthesis protein EgtB
MATQQPVRAIDALGEQFCNTRDASVSLAERLSDADATVQSMPDTSPTKWHLAHTTWFFETFVLRDHVPSYRVFNAGYHYLFNSYYDGEGDRHARPMRGMLTRPSLDEILAYRAHVDNALAVIPHAARDLVELGCQHEAQHQELLLTDILHLFAQNPLLPAYGNDDAKTPLTEPGKWIDGHSGIVEIGHAGRGFGFDCEGPRHRVFLEPHQIASRLVTNAEWRAFVDDGGYRRPELWLSDGWAWRQNEDIAAPLYWREEGAFGLSGLKTIDNDAPVTHVSQYEADAFARWAGARLPTESEWEAAAGLNGVTQMFDCAWQWTSSAYLPYPRFRAAPGAVGEYNGKFMSGQMVLRGSSHATPAWTARVTVRNFFPPTARWQFSGLRLARDL